MRNKKLNKPQWNGNDIDNNGKPVYPKPASEDKPLEGLIRGEIYVHDKDERPRIVIRTDKDNIKEIGGGVDLIKTNDDTPPSNENVYSAKRALEEHVSKLNDDTAAGLLTLLKGLVAKGLIEANAGLVVRKQELTEASLMSLIEEGEDSLVEELSTSGSNTIGELDNVSLEADTAPNGSILVKEEDIWSPVPPIASEFTDYDNMLMPVFHKVLGKWVFISVSSISGGVTPPVSLEMVLDSGILDRDILGAYDDTGVFVLDNSKLDQSKLI